MKELAEALIVAAQASEREAQFRDRLKSAGVMFIANLRPMPFTHLRDPVNNYNSTLANWFRDGVKHGLLSVEDVPAEWREGWGME